MSIIDSIKDKIYYYSNDAIDAFLDLSILFVLSFLISGCSVSPDYTREQAQYHPPWPTPYTVCDVEWKIKIEENKEPYVMLSFDDNLKLASCQYDLIRYIQEMNRKYCHYRPSGDTRCVQKTDQEG